MGNIRDKFKAQRAVVVMLMLIPFLLQITAYYSDSLRLTGEQRYFIAKHPGYGLKGRLFKIRQSQFPYLSSGLVYLQHSQEGLYPVRSLQQLVRTLQQQHPLATNAVNSSMLRKTSSLLLKLLNTNQSAYKVIFKTSRQEVIKVAMTFVQKSDGLVFLAQTHLSDFAKAIRSTNAKTKTFSAWYIKHGVYNYAETYPKLEIDEQGHPFTGASYFRDLVVLPVYDAYSGRRLPLHLVNDFQKDGHSLKYAFLQRDMLLDATYIDSFEEVNLEKYAASFMYIPISRLLGFPLEVHVLIVRTDVYELLQSECAPQVLEYATNHLEQSKAKNSCFMTINSNVKAHELAGIEVSLRLMKAIGNKAIAQHICSLIHRSTEKAAILKLPSGDALVTLVGGRQDVVDVCQIQGGITSFVINKGGGGTVDPSTVIDAAAARKIIISSVCSQEKQSTALQAISPNSLKESDTEDPGIQFPQCVLQISYGYQTTLQDVDAFWSFIALTYGSRSPQ